MPKARQARGDDLQQPSFTPHAATLPGAQDQAAGSEDLIVEAVT